MNNNDLNELARVVYYYKRECRFLMKILIFGNFIDRKRIRKHYKNKLKELDEWFERQKEANKNDFLERIK